MTIFHTLSKCIYERSKCIPTRSLRVLLHDQCVHCHRTVPFSRFSSIESWFYACAVRTEIIEFSSQPTGLQRNACFSQNDIDPTKKAFAFKRKVKFGSHVPFFCLSKEKTPIKFIPLYDKCFLILQKISPLIMHVL